MAQKPMLRAEVGMRVRCANKASAEWSHFPEKVEKYITYLLIKLFFWPQKFAYISNTYFYQP
jgi:hypothetical protein